MFSESLSEHVRIIHSQELCKVRLQFTLTSPRIYIICLKRPLTTTKTPHSCSTRRHGRGAPACPSAGAFILSTFLNVGLLPLAFAICTTILLRLPRQALPSSRGGFVNPKLFLTRIMGDLDFLLYNSRRYMVSPRKTVA